MTTPSAQTTLATIAAMPKPLRAIVLAVVLAAASAGVIGCGSSGPDPSIPPENARILLAKIAEIKANVDVGSCLVAAEKTDDLLSDVADLPSSVNSDVKQALDSGANNLKLQLTDPSKCQGRTETTTTTETTATRRRPRRPPPSARSRPPPSAPRPQTTPTQTQTTPNTTTTPGASGGIGPGGL